MGNLHVVGPNEAIIVSGGHWKKRQKRTVVGGWIWAWSSVTNVQKLPLGLMTLIPKCENVETLQGVPLNVSGVAQCKIMKEGGLLEVAAEQFLGKTVKQIKMTVQMTLEGHLRSILGTLTVEEVYKDREKFASLVWEVAAPDVGKMGIQILSFTIRDVYDDVQYLTSLGKARTAMVKKEADIGVAEANRDAGIKEAICEKMSKDVTYEMHSKIADNSRRYELQKAHFDREVNTAKAEAQLAYSLQAARIQQKIRGEEVEIDIIHRRKQIQIEEEEVKRRELELSSTVRLPAEAESYRMMRIAEGQVAQAVEAARAEGESVRMIGQSEAEVMEIVGKARAEGMKQKALVFQRYGDAALTSLVLQALPKITKEVSAPLAKIEEIVLLGGSDQLTGELNRLLGQLPPSVSALSGVDVSSLLSKLLFSK